MSGQSLSCDLAPPPTPNQDARRTLYSAETGLPTQSTDRLIRDTCIMLSRAGLPVGRSKVSRLVRAYRGPLTLEGAEFVHYLADRLALTVRQRADVADLYRRVIAYADPTGETAVANVVRHAH